MLGQRVSVLSTTIGSGSVSIPIDLSGLNQGLYMVEVKTAQSSATRLVQVSKP
jgi:invasion protein IalB